MQLFELRARLALAEAHSSRHRELELDAGLGTQRHDGDFRGRRARREVSRYRPPENRGIELAGKQLVLDDLAGIDVGIAVERRVRHHLLVHAVASEPLGRGARREHADTQRIASGTRQAGESSGARMSSSRSAT